MINNTVLEEIPDPTPPSDPHVGSPTSSAIVDSLNEILTKVKEAPTTVPVALTDPGSPANFWVTVSAHVIISIMVLYAFYTKQVDVNTGILMMAANWGIAVKGTLTK